jgi:hypothetical protein
MVLATSAAVSLWVTNPPIPAIITQSPTNTAVFITKPPG